jgi:hypothetical protein
MKRANFPEHKRNKRIQAEARQVAYDKLSPEDKLKTIRGRRERKRLVGK